MGRVEPVRVRWWSEAERGAAAIVVLGAWLTGATLLLTRTTAVTVAAAVVLAVLTTMALRSSSPAAVDVMVLTDLLYLAVAIDVLGLWPLPAAVAVVGAWALARRSPRAELWRSWLRRGHGTAEAPWLVLATVVVTVIALVGWQRGFDGVLPDAYLDAAHGRSVGLILVAGIGFALINAAVEESIFRGVLQTSLERLVGPVAAIVVQAGAFGLLHVVGIPTGWVGAVMAGTWGALLGVLRYRTQGMLAPYLAHVAADLTIVVIMLPTLM